VLFALCNFLVRKTFCRNNEFLCSNGEQCIPQGWVCDRATDCSDGSDEKSCGGKNFNKTEVTDSIHDSTTQPVLSVSQKMFQIGTFIAIFFNERKNLIKFSSLGKSEISFFASSLTCFLSNTHTSTKQRKEKRIQQVFNQFCSVKHFAYFSLALLKKAITACWSWK
jgi:Low-density lipoprotein receptor domain class A